MDINLECIYCTIKKADSLFSQYEIDEYEKLKFMKEVFKIVSMSNQTDTSPYINAQIMRLLTNKFFIEDIYLNVKKEYNELLLSKSEEIFKEIEKSSEQLNLALKYAMVGNFIDFGAMDKVDKNKLENIILKVREQDIDIEEYDNFVKDLNDAKEIVYLADNAGEIVFDKIFIMILQKLYKNLKITVIVRGKPIYNDATIRDAKEIGLCEIVEVIDNGTDIPGTQLDKITTKTKEIIDSADLIISKGQGNFETLFGCKKNIYYIFLCKCDLFTKRFNLEKFKGVFVNETNVGKMIK